jgi:predicted short-subunit dehydrogenase-like oxidoreductase (DUF2520 family)
MSHDFCVIGAGKVGTSLAYLLHHAGWEFLGAASRTFASARRACKFVGDGIPADDSTELVHASDITFITTPDDAIEGVCRDLAQQDAIRAGTVLAHCSGALTSEVLSRARDCGAHVGSLHPLQTFPTVERAVDLLPGSWCCIEGDRGAVERLEEAAQKMKIRVMRVDTEKKALYHAAAVVACNYLVTLEESALCLAESAGLERDPALQALMPLIQATVANLEETGPADALTGPIARGDLETVRRHIESMRQHIPELLPLYRVLADRTIDLARQAGSLNESLSEDLKDLLKEQRDEP